MNFPNEMSGNHPLAGWCNKLLRAAKASRVVNGLGYKTRLTSDGTALEVLLGSGGGTPISVSMYRIKSFQGDYMTCRSWNGSSEGATDIYIAKPVKLRNSATAATIDGGAVTYSYDSSTLQRVAASATYGSEIHYIVPRYNVNDVIHAVDSATGVSFTVSSVVTVVSKIDLNVDGRVWARISA